MNYKDVEIIRLFLPLYYLSKLLAVFPLLLIREAAPPRSDWRFWSRFQRSKISDPGGSDTKAEILDKFNSYRTYLRESTRSSGYLRIFRPDRVNLVYTYISVLVVILHGVSAPFYVLHTTLPLQYNDSIFNIDLDEEDEEEEVDVTTLDPLGTDETGNSTDEYKQSVKPAEKDFRRKYSRYSINKRSIIFFELGEPIDNDPFKKMEDEINDEENSHENVTNVDDNSKKTENETDFNEEINKNIHFDDMLDDTQIKTIKSDRNEELQRNSTNHTGQVKENLASAKVKRSVQSYRNSFNRTHYNSTHPTFFRSNALTRLRKNRTNIVDITNVTKEYREFNVVNETGVASLMYDKETKQSLSMKIANPLMITVMCIGSKLTALFFIPENIDKFFSQLLIVDKILKYNPKFHSDQKSFVNNLLIYSFLLSVPINIHYLFTVVEVNNAFGIMWCVILIYTNLSSFLLDLHFIYFNYLLYIRYKYINTQIQMAFNNYSQNNVIIVNNFLIYDYMEVLRECHKKLSDLLKLINYIYQVHLLLALSTCFIKLLFNIYFAMFGYVIGTAVPHSDKEAMELFRTMLWSMYYAMRFLCVVMSADITGEQARRTCMILANVNNRHLDSNTKEELSIFGAYVSSRNLKYTAAGFFSLNSHLITSAISTGTTYLVILVQFHGSKL